MAVRGGFVLYIRYENNYKTMSYVDFSVLLVYSFWGIKMTGQ